jgi:hypothetical protein
MVKPFPWKMRVLIARSRLEEYSLELQAKRYIEIYQKVLGQS